MWKESLQNFETGKWYSVNQVLFTPIKGPFKIVEGGYNKTKYILLTIESVFANSGKNPTKTYCSSSIDILEFEIIETYEDGVIDRSKERCLLQTGFDWVFKAKDIRDAVLEDFRHSFITLFHPDNRDIEVDFGEYWTQ